jgi:hypothetical protein
MTDKDKLKCFWKQNIHPITGWVYTAQPITGGSGVLKENKLDKPAVNGFKLKS